MEMAVELMEMAPGATPRPGGVPEQRLLFPETFLRWRRRSRTLLGKGFGVRSYLSRGICRRKGEGGGTPRGPHPLPARPPLLPREEMVWGPRASTAFALSPTYTPRFLRPNTESFFREEFRCAAATKNPNSRDRSLCFGTLPGRGIAPGVISIYSIAISIAVADSYDEE